MDEKEKWLIDYVIKEQEGNVTNPTVTNSEMEYRLAMAKQFSITEDWAYEVIRKIVARNPNFHLEKVTVEGWNMETNRPMKWREFELTYIEKS